MVVVTMVVTVVVILAEATFNHWVPKGREGRCIVSAQALGWVRVREEVNFFGARGQSLLCPLRMVSGSWGGGEARCRSRGVWG